MQTVIEFICSLNDGGAETLVKDYSLMLDKDAFRPIIVTVFPPKSSANLKVLQDNMIEIISLYPDTKPTSLIINRIFNHYFTARKLWNIAKTRNASAIHVHMALLRYLAPMAGKWKDINLLYTCHSIPERYFTGKNEVEKQAAKQLLKTDHLQMISISEEMREQLNSMFDISDTVYVKNAINFDRFLNVKATKEEIRADIDIPADAFVVGQTARFEHYKNHEFTLKVFRKLLEKQPNAILLLIGDGSLSSVVKQQVEQMGIGDRVTILSHRSDVHRLLKAMDAFILPSKFEGLGIAAIEAQIAGLHCVVSEEIPQDAFVSPLISSLPLSASEEMWADRLLDVNYRNDSFGDIEQFDMGREIKKLEKLYTH